MSERTALAGGAFALIVLIVLGLGISALLAGTADPDYDCALLKSDNERMASALAVMLRGYENALTASIAGDHQRARTEALTALDRAGYQCKIIEARISESRPPIQRYECLVRGK